MHYFTNIEKDTLENNEFRKILHTVKGGMQLVVMSLKPGQEIGMEIHPHVTQFIRVEKGFGVAVTVSDPDDPRPQISVLHDGDSVIIPYGTYHNVINASETESLKLYTIYAPPEHPVE